ncbi:hypothetical protein KGF56_003636 [Candida oxycetoniae]|uniref:Uncharacterized protein n=1 Tax=Candida oxycetoniae TaxID=497107 RepID=A0AAI9SV12_9ASCO|nr:uncharacterized protein KGF56_003636 [Candida oxycetoniae]KAI3403591.2 hypothetical protein KGF56_003636 [Candida oxycetoniae]
MSDIESDREAEREEPKPYYQFGKPEMERREPVRKIDLIGLRLPNKRSGDTMDTDESEVTDVVYEVNKKSQFHTTRALFIGNLRRPINAGNFQQFLRDIASSNKEVRINIDRAWLNRLRTHAIVLVNHEEGAEYMRSKLLGSIYPGEEEDLRLKEEFENHEVERFENEKRNCEDSEEAKKNLVEPREFFTERLPLYVEYIPVKAISQWTFEEDKGPKDGIWKLEFENRGEDTVVSHTLLNGDFIPPYRPPPPPRYGGRRDYGFSRYRGGHDRYIPGSRPSHHSNRGNNYRSMGERDSYVPGQAPPRFQEPRTTDSYVPSRRRDRSRSRSRSPSRSDRY